MSVKENLIKAKELLETAGWGRGDAYDPDTGCYCLLGAIYSARTGMSGEEVHLDFSGPYDHSPEMEAVVKALAETNPALGAVYNDYFMKYGKDRMHTAVYSFNDGEDTTEADVMQVLNRAIEVAE